MALPEELRSVVADCLSPDPAGRPLARAVLTELLSGQDLSAGLLAEGSKAGHAAARTAVSTAAPPRRQTPRRSHSRAVLWIAACAACVLAIAAAAIYITGRHSGPGPAFRAKNSARSATERRRGPRQLTIPAQFAGSWSGTVHQTNPAINVTVRMTLAAGTAHGTIAYPQLPCTGTLAPLSSAPGQLTLRLTIAAGHQNCVSGKIRLATQPHGTLTFTFLQAGGSNPTGTLAKQT
jgi:hypothetical protein